MQITHFIILLMLTLNCCATKVPDHIKRGHLLAAFCIAHPKDKPKQVVAIYREIMPLQAPKSSYTTVAFRGGYVGLAGNRKDNFGDQINFSIWGDDAAEYESADEKYGIIKTRQFTHEGKGWAGRLAFPWETNKKYRVYVHVKHENNSTIFSAWFGSAETNEWLLAGRIKKQGIHYLSHAGGFLEHAGKKFMEKPRSTGYGPSWIHNGEKWEPCTEARVKLKDPENARFYKENNLVIIEIGLGIKSLNGNRFNFELSKLTPEPPNLPEPVNPKPQ